MTLLWRSPKAPLDYFIDAFGDPEHDETSYIFPNEVRLSKDSHSSNYLITFNPELDLSTEFLCLSLEKTPFYKRRTVQLYRAKAVWCLAFPGQSYAEVEARALRIAEISLPRLSHAQLQHKWDTGPFNEGTAVSGRVTAYYQEICKNNEGEYSWVMNPSWEVAVSLRKIDDTWNICIEVTLHNRFFVQNDIPMCIPKGECPHWLKRLPLERFFEFSIFDMLEFRKELSEHLIEEQPDCRESKCTYEQIQELRRKMIELESAIRMPTCEQKHIAYKIAEELKLKRLMQRIKDDEFEQPYNPFK